MYHGRPGVDCRAVAAAHREDTDEASPKRLETMHEYSAPYIFTDKENEQTARNRLDEAERLLKSSASTKSATAGPPTSVPGMTKGWGK